MVEKEYATANVIENETLVGNIRVNGNTNALVQKNIAAQNLICKENNILSAFINFAGITENCDALNQ